VGDVGTCAYKEDTVVSRKGSCRGGGSAGGHCGACPDTTIQRDLTGMPSVGEYLGTQCVGACAFEVSTCIACLQHKERPIKGIIRRPITNANAEPPRYRCDASAAPEYPDGAMSMLPHRPTIIGAICPQASLHNAQKRPTTVRVYEFVLCPSTRRI